MWTEPVHPTSTQISSIAANDDNNDDDDDDGNNDNNNDIQRRQQQTHGDNIITSTETNRVNRTRKERRINGKREKKERETKDIYNRIYKYETVVMELLLSY